MRQASKIREEVPEQDISLIHVLINMYVSRMLLSCTSIYVSDIATLVSSLLT